ncbi:MULTISPECIES: ABC transporter permease [Methylosinus]|uniref:Putrescine ABC transporter permease n=1 Tax=Methylosinus trichosporium (strain ATCC 35070 / NCIMB 11131 / UNIQEM 75 / OB3b) TaxID=595536 RepID=A0A2D2D4Q7_METT3|nr:MULTISPECIES: ABC transporter permease subunit [Methylosinus]ATQ70001.1 putrescine ABC transporter permease [Methylosinus trichosporium OB3b]OBS50370.1 putrescine ABC transporter permease PotH [Methylosinus sp. 3S-1]
MSQSPPPGKPRKLTRGEWLVIAAPAAWIALFFLAPFALIVKISLSQPTQARPPYEPVFDLTNGVVAKLAQLGFDAYRGLAADSLYLDSYLSSLGIAGAATLISLLIAYPFALAIARAPRRWRPLLIGLAVAPFWTSFLIRVYAWIALLKDEGFINHALMWLGLIDAPLPLFATRGAVVIGIVYSYLPFMLLPLYAAIEGQDPSLREAAADLGASPAAVFLRVTLPLSRRGIIAGALLVFIPAVGEFVIPDLLGGSDTLMIGRSLWNDFFANRDWPAACAAAVTLLALLLVPILFFERAQMREGQR